MGCMCVYVRVQPAKQHFAMCLQGAQSLGLVLATNTEHTQTKPCQRRQGSRHAPNVHCVCPFSERVAHRARVNGSAQPLPAQTTRPASHLSDAWGVHGVAGGENRPGNALERCVCACVCLKGGRGRGMSEQRSSCGASVEQRVVGLLAERQGWPATRNLAHKACFSQAQDLGQLGRMLGCEARV